MIIGFEDWMDSEYITIDEKGWHCSEEAPEDIKQKFEEFLSKTKTGVNLVIEE